MIVRITSLSLYPIKSCAGICVSHLPLDRYGAVGDRRYLLVRAADGRFLTQREHPRMACLRPALAADGCLTVATAGTTLNLAPPNAATVCRRPVTIWRGAGTADDCGDKAAAWFSDFLKTDCRLVHLPPDWNRPAGDNEAVNSKHPVAFVDGYPLLVTSEASLADLNTRLDAPVPMDRFRPNMVVMGGTAWAEEGWQTLTHRTTGVALRVAKPCARCAIITIDQTTGEATGSEPLRTLAERRDPTGRVLFGANLLHDPNAPLTLRVGDEWEAA